MAQYYNPVQTRVNTAPQMNMSGVNQSIAGTQNVLADMQNRELKNRALLNRQSNADRNFLLQQEAGKRAQAGLQLQQDAAAMRQAKEASQQFTDQTIGNILAEKDINKRRTLLDEASSMGGFNPDANAQKLLYTATTDPVTKAPTGTVTINKDGKYTNIPISNLATFQKQGWEVGRDYKGKGTRSLLDKNKKAYTDLHKRVGDYGASLLGVQFSDDIDESNNILNAMEAVGLNPNIATRVIDNIDAKGGDRVLNYKSLNNEIPPMIDESGNSIKFGDALELRNKEGWKVTTDANGNYHIAKPMIPNNKRNKADKLFTISEDNTVTRPLP